MNPPIQSAGALLCSQNKIRSALNSPPMQQRSLRKAERIEAKSKHMEFLQYVTSTLAQRLTTVIPLQWHDRKTSSLNRLICAVNTGKAAALLCLLSGPDVTMQPAGIHSSLRTVLQEVEIITAPQQYATTLGHHIKPKQYSSGLCVRHTSSFFPC